MASGLAFLAMAGVTLLPASEIRLESRSVRLADVASGAGGGMAALEIARIPDGRTSVTLNRAELASLIRRALPGSEVGLNGEGAIRLVAPAPGKDIEGCLELMVGRGADEEILESDVRPAPCVNAPLRLRYDPARGANVAPAPLEAGALLAPARLAGSRPLRRGDRLTLASRSGPVSIERPVTALQQARPGDRRIFVRTGDGDILSAAIGEEGGQ